MTSPHTDVASPMATRSMRPSAIPRVMSELNISNASSRKKSSAMKSEELKELEAEYDGSDEEVPENAILSNIPISPISTSSWHFYSAHEPYDGSSPTAPQCASHGSLHLTKTRASNSTTTSSRISPCGSPRSPVVASPLSQVIAVSDGLEGTTKPRQRSWEAALTDLSDEARNLTQALERYAATSQEQEWEHMRRSSARPTVTGEGRARSRITALSNIRKGNVMMDPLPISKEKDKVLTKTRPSWLPPKCQKEERRHLKAYQNMMSMAAHADKKREARQEQEKRKKEQETKATDGLWHCYILPQWGTAVKEPQVRELFWQGVPGKYRAEAWMRAAGNDLELQYASYKNALKRVKSKVARGGRERDWLKAIEEDAKAVWPDLKVFRDDGPLKEALVDVCMAYACYRSDIGYVHGTHVSFAGTQPVFLRG